MQKLPRVDGTISMHSLRMFYQTEDNQQDREMSSWKVVTIYDQTACKHYLIQ